MTDENIPSNETQEIQDQLVAYLDGELEADQVADVERALSEDADFRAKLQKLQQAWDCLDMLPSSEVDDSFTRSTMEMVALTAEQDLVLGEEQLAKGNTMWLFGLAAMCVLALGIGFLGLRIIGSRENRDLLENWSFYQRLELYKHAESIQHLEALQGVAREFQTTQDASPTIPNFPGLLQTDVPRDTVRQKIVELSPENKQRLQKAMDDFAAMPAEQQQKLLTLHADVEKHPDRDNLLIALAAYTSWLDMLDGQQKAELLSLQPQERIEELKRVAARHHKEQAIKAMVHSKSDDRRIVAGWVMLFFTKHRDELMAQVTPEERERLKYQPVWRSGTERARIFHRLLEEGKAPVPSSQELSDLRSKLSPESVKLFGDWNDGAAVLNTSLAWMKSMGGIRGGAMQNTRLKEMLSRMSDEDRKRFEQMRREDMLRELSNGGWMDEGTRRAFGGPGSKGTGGKDRGPKGHRPNDGRQMDGRSPDGRGGPGRANGSRRPGPPNGPPQGPPNGAHDGSNGPPPRPLD